METKKIMKVRQLENKNQFIMENEKETIFQSYNSIIAVLDKENQTLTLGCDWDYSKTTLKHLYIFIREEVLFYLPIEKREELEKALNSTNTRKAIQKLIDNKKINYESELM